MTAPPTSLDDLLQICNLCHDARPQQRRLVDPNDRTPDSDDEEGVEDEDEHQQKKATTGAEDAVLTSIKEQEESCVVC
jgi:hypothetical protein